LANWKVARGCRIRFPLSKKWSTPNSSGIGTNESGRIPDGHSYFKFLITNFMKRIFIAVMALVFNTFLFSCTNDSIAETDSLYKTQSTEGDDSNPPPPPPKK
jgi:hypothetical protein